MSTTFPSIVIFLMAVIISQLFVVLRKLNSNEVNLTLSSQFSEEVEKLNQAARHHIEVSAVVGLIRQLDADPEVAELMKEYPKTVSDAAYLHQINLLGSDLQVAQKRLSDAHRDSVSSYFADSIINDAQHHVDMIREKLDAAIEASGFDSLRSI